MKKITEIYDEYKIMPNLQLHQLRVATVASMVCDSLDVKTDKESIVRACLLHDMGNIIKFDLAQTKSIFGMSDIEIKEIAETQKEYIEKYGENEHEATVKIMKELGLHENVVRYADQNRFTLLCDHSMTEDVNEKIIHYADSRVGPHGILSYEERMNDASERYKNHKNNSKETERQRLASCGKEIEKQIFAHSNIKPEDINNESVKGGLESLKDYSL